MGERAHLEVGCRGEGKVLSGLGLSREAEPGTGWREGKGGP
jgi:hypothetical protein